MNISGAMPAAQPSLNASQTRGRPVRSDEHMVLDEGHDLGGGVAHARGKAARDGGDGIDGDDVERGEAVELARVDLMFPSAPGDDHDLDLRADGLRAKMRQRARELVEATGHQQHRGQPRCALGSGHA